MTAASNNRTHELEEAFGLFNRVSGQLADSYRTLEARVASLDRELRQTRAERAREQNEHAQLANRLRHLLDALPAGIVALDGHGVVQESNPAASDLLGEPLRGQRWVDVIARAFAPRANDGYEISLRDGRRVNVATRALDPESGQLVLLTDLSSTRLLQEQLARHERLAAMGEMVASLAHQLRTPLATALLYISFLTRDGLPESERLRATDRIHGRLQHLEHLINDMLLFARGGSSAAAPVIPAMLADEIAKDIQPRVNAAGCRFVFNRSETSAVVLGNRDAIQGAVVNLIDNAIEACGTGGEIVLSLSAADDDHVQFTVHDNGPGIEPELQARLFEPFFTTRAAGTGLGLAVVQAVARAHGGEAWVKSVPGAGASFGLTLPVIESRRPPSVVGERAA